jgi:hypothetical protein
MAKTHHFENQIRKGGFTHKGSLPLVSGGLEVAQTRYCMIRQRGARPPGWG